MLTLATHQSATWGYSYVNYPTTAITAVGGTPNNVGLFTKPILAPNGKMYAVNVVPSITINGVVRTNVILRITPGSTNTKTTNWSAATFEYIFPDASFPTTNGFSRPTWSQGNQAATTQYNSGVLAPNGLIYFSVLLAKDSSGTFNNKWLVFNPDDGANETWKYTQIYPGYSESQGLNGYQALFAPPVLATDGKIYVIRTTLNTFYRFTPTTNAATDISTIQQSTTSYTTVTHPLIGTGKQWQDESGAFYTDSDSATGVFKATGNLEQYDATCAFNMSDAIAHPNGNIYWIPGKPGRGRIFYTKPSLFSTIPFISAPGLITPGSPQKTSNFYYAFLEKPRDADHDPATLKIYIVSRLSSDSNIETQVLCLDPTDNTISTIDLGISATRTSGLTKPITLANGMHLSLNFNGGSLGVSSGRNILTGWDVPESAANGAIIITKNNKGILDGQMGGSFSTSAAVAPGQTAIGGGINAPYPHHSKFISHSSSNPISAAFSELVSVKQYGDEITNFNFADRDKNGYAPPTNLAGLPASLFNSNFNKSR